ncbi:MAG: hypothetical protein QOH57_2888 [Mycobacterium sp.]|jgi:hypothetical protein|nr:hypothetical protein [Mycobacterium sp.]
MSFFKTALPAAVIAGGLTAALLGVGAEVASADPPPPPPPQGEVPPPNAPPKPDERWDGQPIVWTSGWGGRWGVYINGQFITLSSNINTGGG